MAVIITLKGAEFERRGRERRERENDFVWSGRSVKGRGETLRELKRVSRGVTRRESGMRMQRISGRMLLGLLLVSAAAAGAWGQGQQAVQPTVKAQEVVIRVTDPAGTNVRGAQVRVVPEPAPAKMETDGKGELLLQLKPGGYAVFVRAAGFASSATHMDVKESGERQGFPVVLAIGASGSPSELVPVAEKDWLTLRLYPFHENTRISPAEFKTLPHTTVTVHNAHSNADEKYEGVLLGDLLTKYGAPLGKELHGVALAAYIVASGADGYVAVFSLAEVDPSFHPGDVLVADTMDGKALDARSGPLKLVVTEDKCPARGVRNLVSLELKIAK